MRNLFPTYTGVWRGSFQRLRALWSPWLSTPWWPADSLVSKQRGLLRMLAAAAAERLEAAPLVACLAQEHRNRYRRRLRRLALRLSAGMPLADALEQTPGTLSDEQALAVRFGDQSGMLTAILRSLLTTRNQAAERIAARLRNLAVYPAAVLVVFVFIMMFYCIKIIPSFRAIFQDFDLQLPVAMQMLIFFARLVEHYWYLIALLVIGITWLLKSETSRRFLRRNVLSRVMPPVARLRSADLLDLLATTIDEGRPLAGALATLARYHVDSFIRGKLLFVRNEVELGADIWNSMATARLISPAEARALECSTSNESRSWTLRQFAQLRRNHVARRVDVVASVFEPLVVLLLAAMVLFVAVACMSPLFNMIAGLSG